MAMHTEGDRDLSLIVQRLAISEGQACELLVEMEAAFPGESASGLLDKVAAFFLLLAKLEPQEGQQPGESAGRRPLTSQELFQQAQALHAREAWERARAFALRVYGPDARTVAIRAVFTQPDADRVRFALVTSIEDGEVLDG